MINNIDGYIKENTTKEEFESLSDFCSMVLEVGKDNPNEYTNYSKYILNEALGGPETIIIPLDIDIIKYLYLGKFDSEINKVITEYVLEFLHNNDFNTDRDLFLKDGKCSFKFDFSKPFIPKGSISSVGDHVVDICYNDICMHDFVSPTVLLREFIHTTYDRPSIYNGMKLNTEFRVFYDFDSNKIMGIVNYWDYDTMVENLKNNSFDDLTDYNTFLSCGKSIENDFSVLKPKLTKLINNIFPHINMTGTWSSDFLWDGERFRLIDMALASQSYYYEKVLKK